MRSVEITISSVSAAELAVSIDYRLQASPIVRKWQVSRPVVEGIWHAIRESVTEALRESGSSGMAPERAEEIASCLRSLGLALFQEMLKDECDRIRDLAAAAVTSSGERPTIIFKIDKVLAYLPLEMMHDGRAFLCHSLPVGRVLYADQAEVRVISPEREPYSVVVVGDPSEDGAIRRDVEREVDAVRNVFKSRRDFVLKIAVGHEADQKRILGDLPGATVFHLSGHGVVSDDERLSGVRLSDGTVLSGYSLKGLQNAPAFVFLNVCTPASEETWKGSLGLIETLLRRGTRACIASLWELESPSATFVASRFYAHLKAGVTFGEALRRARLEAAESFGFHDPTWAAYVLYGDPARVLLERADEEPVEGAEEGAGRPAGPGRRRETLRRAALAAALLLLAALVLIPVATMRDRATLDTGGRPPAPDSQEVARPQPLPVGYLVVESTPRDAKIILDGKEAGTTPNTFEVPVGTHEVVLDRPGYKRWEASVEVKQTPRATVNVTMERIRR